MRRKITATEILLVLLVLVVAFVVRVADLDRRPFWVDEAESSINALTILEKGYPTDTYLGLPIYENTLIQPWPESQEYEFRDVSYSDNHLAVYHGWLPLYAIAASFAFHRVEPDRIDQLAGVKHDLRERKRRTRAARIPAVLFGLLFLVVTFVAARILFGRDAAWAALVMASVYPYHIALSRQARYYSAQVAATTFCCFALLLLLQRGKWKHVFLAATALILLFYTHLHSFGTAGVVLLVVTPLILRRHEAAIRKLAVLAGLVAAGTLPWILVTGFYSHQSRIPRAWSLLEFPADLVRNPPIHMSSSWPGFLIACAVVWLVIRRSKVSRRFSGPALRLYPILLFVALWAACGYATFLCVIPAVSFDRSRINFSYWGPVFLLGSIMCAAVARVLAPRHSTLVAPALIFAAFFLTGHTLKFDATFSGGDWAADAAVLDQLATSHLDSSTKVFAAPNDHLPLTFYSGFPVQDITPVRKTFLDSYKGDIIYVDRTNSIETGSLTPENVQKVALRYGYELSEDAAKQWSELLRTRDYREAMNKDFSDGAALSIEDLPAFGPELMAAQHCKVLQIFTDSSLELITRGFTMHTWSDWRVVLKYRFLDPFSRGGQHANYVDRLRGATAILVTRAKADTAFYRSSWHPPRPPGPVEFQFVK